LPIQCTGLLTSDFDEFDIPKEAFLVNTFSEIEVNSPSGKQAAIRQKEYLVDRHRFDNYLAEMARKAGAKVHLQHSFIRKEGDKLVVKDLSSGKELIVAPEVVIAADGPLSKTAKAFGFYHPERKNYYGVQAMVEGKFGPQRYQTFFGNSVCPDLFAWIVPESERIARVGLASTKDSRKWFDRFMAKQDFKVLGVQGGVIPLYSHQQKLQQENCYLLGDASSFVKATTLGGIIPGMKQAEILARCITEGRDYEKETRQLKKRMHLHLHLRKMFNKFSDRDWDRLVELLGQEKMQRILQQHTRENPLPLVLKALLREPRLGWFGRYVV
jgi:flavin-dependent dehydrogenase